MRIVKPIIEWLLDVLKHIGHPFFFTFMMGLLLWGVTQEWCSPTLAILAAAFFGVITGFGLALKVFSHIIVKHPESVIQTVGEWKSDGRWDQLLAYIERERRGS